MTVSRRPHRVRIRIMFGATWRPAPTSPICKRGVGISESNQGRKRGEMLLLGQLRGPTRCGQLDHNRPRRPFHRCQHCRDQQPISNASGKEGIRWTVHIPDNHNIQTQLAICTACDHHLVQYSRYVARVVVSFQPDPKAGRITACVRRVAWALYHSILSHPTHPPLLRSCV